MAYRELELTLVSARDLKNVNLITRMDVYAVVTISGDPLTRQCTAPDPSGGRNPRWDATLRFAVPPTADAAAGSCLHVLLRAERVLGDRDVGEVIIPLADLLAGAPATGPQQPRVASYQVRKVHRWEPRGVLHVSYRLGSVVAPVVENKPPPPAVMDMGYSYPPVGVPSSSQPFHPQADAYQPPQPAHPPRPAAKANKHDPAPAPAPSPSPSPRNGKSNGLGQVFVGPHTQIIFGGGGGGPPATTTTMSSSSSPTGSNVSSPRKPHGAWHTRQMELHHDHGDTQGRRPFQETEATSQLRAPVPAASREGAAAAGATVSPRGPSPRPPVSTFSSHSSGSSSPPPYSTASQRAPVVVAASKEPATMSPRGPSRQLPVSTSFSSHGSSSSRSPPPDSPAHRFPFTPSPARSATHSSTNSPYTARHPYTTPSPRALGHSATTDAFGSSDTKSSPCVPTHGRAAVSLPLNSSPLVANHTSMVPSR